MCVYPDFELALLMAGGDDYGTEPTLELEPPSQRVALLLGLGWACALAIAAFARA